MSITEFARRVEALRRPLQFAAQDGFAAMDRIRDLGETLRAASDRLTSLPGAEPPTTLLAWRQNLDAFESMDRSHRSVEIARGLRLCRELGGRPPKPAVALSPPTDSPGISEPPAELPPLARPTSVLPRIGPALEQRLGDRNLTSVEDLIWFVPRRYDDARAVVPLAEAIAASTATGDRVTTEGQVARCRFNRNRRARWVDLRLRDDSDGELVVRWFNAHGGMAKRFPQGARVVLSGRVRERASAAEMANPDVLSITLPDGTVKEAPGRIIARYGDVPGVPPATLRHACVAAIELGRDHLTDGVPAAVAERRGLCSLSEALLGLHAPGDDITVEHASALNDGTSPWHRRLAFDELFFLGLAVARRRRARRADRAAPCANAPELAGELHRTLPFTPTGAQQRAIDAIAGDLCQPVPMNRLLQGDVGSGKTAVAFAAALQVVRAGRQVAIMAPTEILAEQHAAAFAPWCTPLGIRTALLTASTARAVRSSTLSLLQAGEIDIAIGTHALIADGVAFGRLGLAVIDEQHRFGVAQRVRLRGKGDGAELGGSAPHLLVMTATPIPRTLALTAYGDLDETVIDELPPGRQPVTTAVKSGKRGRDSAYKLVVRELSRNARVFVVCPLVEPSQDEETGRRDWADATSVHAELCDRLAPARVGLIHGRLGQADRDQVMTAFRSGQLDVLVATTVIEVGVDIPEATVMVIEDADRFGLAQLHQLRGRVGRGGGAAHCLLLTRGGKTASGAERLQVMATCDDGFAIAEHDLRIRGPGELLGARQAGLPKLRFGDLQHYTELLTEARTEATQLLDRDPELAAHPVTREVLDWRTRDAPVYGAEGG